MSEYTPTTEEVRIIHIGTREEFAKPWQGHRAGEFDRWLAAHDAEVRERALREAEDAAADALNTWWLTDTAPDDDTSSVMDVRKAVRALRAGVVAEEPEWEYGNEQLMHSRTEIFPASSEAVAKAQSWLYPVHRRRKAGPWLPVEN